MSKQEQFREWLNEVWTTCSGVTHLNKDRPVPEIAAKAAEIFGEGANEPIDDGWLASVGVWNNDLGAYVVRHHRLSVWFRANGQAGMHYDSLHNGGSVSLYARLKTRADVLDLLRALKITPGGES